MQKSQVIPFRFEAREVRTLLIDDQPWFVAGDVSAALCYRDAFNMCRNLDDDERGTQIVSTPSGDQEMTIINESGLYSAILRSRKVEAKRFKKWITAEVLPAIRRHGRYEDSHNKMATLVGEVLGVTELSALKSVMRDKAKAVPKERRLSFLHTMHHRLRTRFNVPRTEMIPHKDFADACNFIAAYSLEGEWLPKPSEPEFDDWLNLNGLISLSIQAKQIFDEYNLYTHLRGLGCDAAPKLNGRLSDMALIAGLLYSRHSAALNAAEHKATCLIN